MYFTQKENAIYFKQMDKLFTFAKNFLEMNLVQDRSSFNTIGKPGQPQGIAPTICP
jgi:hypothetical protein